VFLNVHITVRGLSSHDKESYLVIVSLSVVLSIRERPIE